MRIGEPFTIHLTCSALETEAATAVVDRSRLGTASVQFPPFEVTSGTQSADHVTAGRRFMQYHYNVRLIAEDFFGSDIVIPALAITYRIESRVQQDSAVQGREQAYELPALTMRINSLVANDARHIREAPVPSFDEIAARDFRAQTFRVLALILFALAGLTLVVALLGWLRRGRKAELATARHFLPHRTVLATVRRELAAIQQQARGAGWSLDTVARALAAGRVVGSYFSGQVVAQHEAERTTSGEIGVARGLIGRRRIAVSAATTAQALNHASPGDLDAALTTLTAARYGRAETYNDSALDEALESVMRAAGRASARHTWLAESTRSIGDTIRGWAPQAWAR
ncbi:MAG TPA: hypothetical protein VMO26_30565 [Vicinamibacterales bacterium]|nr:hypothetical protein [Vicinamibacterales bacterium]